MSAGVILVCVYILVFSILVAIFGRDDSGED